MKIKPKLLVIGSGGYVGKVYRDYLASNEADVWYLPSRSFLDFTNKDILANFIKRANPRFVINCAGYTGKPNVDACETDRNNCLKGNVTFPLDLAEICNDMGITLGHVSSGCIYSGRREDGKGFTETDTPNFSFRTNDSSFYSGTKALCEEMMSGYNNIYIWRLRIPFNNIDSPRNYLTKLMTYSSLLEAENSISHLDEFVEATIRCIVDKAPKGIYNVTNTGYVTTSGVVDLLKKYGLPNKNHDYKFFDDLDDFMQKAAKTPRSNCVLDNTKLTSLGIEMSESYEAIEKSLINWKTK
jgi:dTDP-4-dehydrorhamnose reductase